MLAATVPDLVDDLRQALGDRYAVEREIGRGGMATVFLAEDVKHRRLVAIKVLHAELAAALGAERFLREIEIAAGLQHPHILPLYDSGAAGGFLYYVMPYVEGESLRDRLNREKQLSLEDALRIATEVAGALAYAHSRGIVHRDIKPENIMLSAGTAVVADFGIARAVTVAGAGGHLTQTGTIIGTPAYMSPEQATAGGELDGRSDEYSLACVVYEMLVGAPPFTGPTAQAIIARHSLDMVSPPSIVRATIPDAVEEAILRALSKVPADRYATTALFAEALNTPSAATGAVRRATLGRGAARPPSRLRRLAPVAALVVLAAGYVTYQSLRSGRAAPPGGGGLDPRRIAVLYFEDQSAGKSLGYLADGLTEALIDELGRVQSLSVVSRNGAAQYRAADLPRDSIAHLLGAGTLVAGSVEEAGPRLRVTVRLVDGGSGADIRRQSFELPRGAVLSMRDSLVREAAGFLRERLGEEIRVREELAQTKSVEAWTLLQRAERLRQEAEQRLRSDDVEGAFATLDRADTLLAQAQRADPMWAGPVLLQGQLAQRRARALQVHPAAMVPWIAAGVRDARRALELAPSDAAALELLGTVRFYAYFFHLGPPAQADAELRAARDDLQAAVQIRPLASAYATLSALEYHRGDLPAVVIAAQRAYEEDAYLDNADQVLWRLFLGYYDGELHDKARDVCDEGGRRFPRDYHFVECQLWVMTTGARPPDVPAAWRLFARLDSLAPAAVRASEHYQAMTAVGAIIGRAGLKDSARHVLLKSRAGWSTPNGQEVVGHEAFARTLIGDYDEAIALLKRYIAGNPEHLFRAGGDLHWWWRPLKDKPGFRAISGAGGGTRD
jgi:eukaryotic-like serine/threonine-protein kinase